MSIVFYLILAYDLLSSPLIFYISQNFQVLTPSIPDTDSCDSETTSDLHLYRVLQNHINKYFLTVQGNLWMVWQQIDKYNAITIFD